MSNVDVPALEALPTELLLRLARREVEDDDVAMPALCALHRRPSREVFERAAALVALHIIPLLQAYGIAVWLPEAGGPANLDNPTHQALIMMLGHHPRPRRNARLAPRCTRRP